MPSAGRKVPVFDLLRTETPGTYLDFWEACNCWGFPDNWHFSGLTSFKIRPENVGRTCLALGDELCRNQLESLRAVRQCLPRYWFFLVLPLPGMFRILDLGVVTHFDEQLKGNEIHNSKPFFRWTFVSKAYYYAVDRGNLLELCKPEIQKLSNSWIFTWVDFAKFLGFSGQVFQTAMGGVPRKWVCMLIASISFMKNHTCNFITC